MATTYKKYGNLDDPIGEDLDRAWYGMDSRKHPANLEQGIASFIKNGRLDKQTYKPRKGVKRMSKGIKIAEPPLVLPFTLPSAIQVDSLSMAGTIATVTTAVVHGYLVDQKVEIAGATDSAYDGTWTIIATPTTTTFTVDISATPANEATTPATSTRRLVIKNTYADGVFSSTVFKDDSDDNEYIVLATGSKAFFVDPDNADNPTEIAYSGSESIDANDEVSLIQCLNKVIMLRGGSKTALQFNGDLGADTFDPVSTSAITSDPLNNIPGTVATTNGSPIVTGTNTFFREELFIGQRIQINGEYHFVAGITSDVDLTTESNLASTGATETLYKNIDRFSMIPMPNSSHGTFYQNRLILPRVATSDTEFIMSDILDITTYDAGLNQFKLLSGTADSLVGFAPYQEDRMVVLMKKSLHLMNNLSGSLSDVTAFEITRTVGCEARKTIVVIGNRIMFLSRSGVYSLEDGFEHKLRGNSEPLSKAIDDQIQTINWASASDSTSIFYNNRYYIAVPVGTSTVNNRVFVYSFLNEQWESTDIYPSSVEIADFHVAEYAGEPRLFTVGFTGQLSLMEELENDEYGTLGDTLTSSSEIIGQLKTRAYTMSDSGVKRFQRANIDTELADGDIIATTAITVEPTSTTLVQTDTNTTGSTVNRLIRPSLKTKRGYSVQLQLDTTGRPDIKSATVEGSMAFRERQSFE